jgi:hypothetical protein
MIEARQGLVDILEAAPAQAQEPCATDASSEKSPGVPPGRGGERARQRGMGLLQEKPCRVDE